MDDRRILKLLLSRAEEAIDAMAKRFGCRLTQTSRHILGDWQEAEENVNDTYLAVWNAVPPREPDPLSGFVYATGRNLAFKRLRRNSALCRNSSYDLSLEELEGCIAGTSLEDEFDARQLGLAIDRYLSALPRMSRILFLRRYWFGDSVRQLAKHFDMSENAVRTRLHRIRAGLRSYLIKEGLIDEGTSG
jgi:RNA polymerase sigma-70 factor (ECF subfamily)